MQALSGDNDLQESWSNSKGQTHKGNAGEKQDYSIGEAVEYKSKGNKDLLVLLVFSGLGGFGCFFSFLPETL